LTFDTGKATLQPSSEEQLNNIAEILKAYPNVHLKIGGYTDNTGDAAANQALSDARAKNVMDDLVSKGVAASRLESQGYGDQYPVGDNSTEEGRQKNRRIAMRVTQK
jgi:outer membrane protein OmpA-like peptidoglycan-associated protein